VVISNVGEWVPITELDATVKELFDVNDEGQEVHLRDEAAKLKEAETKKQIKEIRDAEDRLKNVPDTYDEPESITFYTMKRTTDMKLTEAIQIKIRELDGLQKKLGEQRIILKRLEKKYPQYHSDWIHLYNEERQKISLTKFIPGKTQFEEYDSLTLEELEKTFDSPKPEATGGSSTIKYEKDTEEGYKPMGSKTTDKDDIFDILNIKSAGEEKKIGGVPENLISKKSHFEYVVWKLLIFVVL
jgi:hypothetical protein